MRPRDRPQSLAGVAPHHEPSPSYKALSRPPGGHNRGELRKMRDRNAALVTAAARHRAIGVRDRWPERSRAAGRARHRPIDHDMLPRHRGAGTPHCGAPRRIPGNARTGRPPSRRLSTARSAALIRRYPPTPPRKSSANCAGPRSTAGRVASLAFRPSTGAREPERLTRTADVPVSTLPTLLRGPCSG